MYITLNCYEQAEIDYAESFQNQAVLTTYLHKTQKPVDTMKRLTREVRDSPLKSLSKTAPVFRNLSPPKHSESQPLLSIADQRAINSMHNIDMSKSAPLLFSSMGSNNQSAPNSPGAGSFGRRAVSPINPFHPNNSNNNSRLNSPSGSRVLHSPSKDSRRGLSVGVGSRGGSRAGSVSPAPLSPSAGRSGIDYTSLASSMNFSAMHASRPGTAQSVNSKAGDPQQTRESLTDLVNKRLGT